MVKGRKTKISNAKKSINKVYTFIIFFCVFILFIGVSYSIYTINDEIVKDNYYTGNVDSFNYAANLLDMIDEDKNIVFSPFNMNVNLAFLYNGVDNSTRNQFRKYFSYDENKVNKEYSKRLEILNNEEVANEFNALYEEYIGVLKDKGYDSYSLNNIMSLKEDEKRELQLLLKKISLCYDRINEKNNVKKNSIVNYVLSEKEIFTNDYLLKNSLDDVIDKYEEYIIKNNVTNCNIMYTRNLVKKDIKDKFINDTLMYNVDIENIADKDSELVYSEVSDMIGNITDKRVKRIGSSSLFSEDMVLINFINFDYSWEVPFETGHNATRAFMNYDGTYSSAQVMFSEENIYLENSYARGFIKNFKDDKYSFVAILPNTNGNFKLSSLNIDSLFKSAKKKNILVGLPQFEYQSEIDLKKLNKRIGIDEIYSEKANMTKMTDRNIYINKNIQKAFISIGNKGTRKSISKKDTTEAFSYEDDEKIIIDRPFAFMIIDNKTNNIIYMGKVIKI